MSSRTPAKQNIYSSVRKLMERKYICHVPCHHEPDLKMNFSISFRPIPGIIRKPDYKAPLYGVHSALCFVLATGIS